MIDSTTTSAVLGTSKSTTDLNSHAGGSKVKKEDAKAKPVAKDKSRMKQLLYSLKTDKSAPGVVASSS